ncbi:hypothetical protein BD560DRAFT_439979 [Blakeslea trispora]|nr:hypothetical protein BD560DRAFT_439979 [Blakeslea trispora]
MLETITCCCEDIQCTHLQNFVESFKRIEYDALLAAEIGQALLQEKDECADYSAFKQNLHELKQLRRQLEQSNELAYTLKAEVESLKTKNAILHKKIDDYENEKQAISTQAIKEEELMTQVLDLKQELNQLKKSENNTKLKYKRLNTSFETLQLTHEALLKEHDALIAKKETKLVQDKQTKICHDQFKDTCLETVAPQPISNQAAMKRDHSAAKSDKQVKRDHPFGALHLATQQTMNKINATDTRVLNRRLKRAFDMSELSDLSNSMLSKILTDLSQFKTQFDWVHQRGEDMDQHAILYFFPLVLMIQTLLKEISTMRMTLNDLQADYVRRIERLTNSHTHYTSMVANYNIKNRVPKAYPKRITKRRNPIERKETFMQGLVSFFSV